MAVSSGPVVEGEWNSNFSNVLAAARATHKPLVMVWSSSSCPHCSRLERAMEGATFLAWQRSRKLPMLFVRANSKDPAFADSREFARVGSQELDGYPYVCVWWLKPDGTECKRNFCGRRGKMSKSRDPSLAVQLVEAIDEALRGYLPEDPAQATTNAISSCIKSISVNVEGASGVAHMKPESGELTEEGEVWLSVRPRPASVFVGWKGPDGSMVSRHRRLRVSYDMPEGCYKAVLRRKSGCRPPEVLLPSTSVCARVGSPFSYAVPVSESSFPLRFMARNLPKGASIDAYDGIISGTCGAPCTNLVELTFIGSDPAHTVCTGTLSVVVMK